MNEELESLRIENEQLKERLTMVVNILDQWLIATPTKQDGSYDPINQPQAYRALKILSNIRGEK